MSLYLDCAFIEDRIMSYSFLGTQRSAQKLVNNRCTIKFSGWMVGWMDGWMAGWMDGLMDRWVDRRRGEWNYIIYSSLQPCGIVIIVLMVLMRKFGSH